MNRGALGDATQAELAIPYLSSVCVALSLLPKLNNVRHLLSGQQDDAIDFAFVDSSPLEVLAALLAGDGDGGWRGLRCLGAVDDSVANDACGCPRIRVSPV